MDNSFGFDNPRFKIPIKFTFPQLCAKCGHYSGERHKYCLLCVDKMKRNGQVEKIHDETIIDIFSTRTPRRKKTKNVRFGQIGNNFCVHCKTEEKQFNSNTCLKCDASKRDLPRSRDTSYSVHSFGNADLILALSKTSSSLVGSDKRDESRCLVCRKQFVVEQNGMCQKCLTKSKQSMPVGRFYKELERILREAVSVKDEFKSMEAIRGGIQWEISFNARRESLKHLLNSVEIKRPRNKEERQKQEDVIYYIKTLIEECTLHFERHLVRGDKQPYTSRH